MVWAAPCTATALNVSAGAVRSRLRNLGRLHCADLTARRPGAPASWLSTPPTLDRRAAALPMGRVSLRVLPEASLGTEKARAWASGLVLSQPGALSLHTEMIRPPPAEQTGPERLLVC